MSSQGQGSALSLGQPAQQQAPLTGQPAAQPAAPAAQSSDGSVTLPSSAQASSQGSDPNRAAWLPVGYDTPEQFREAVDNGTYTAGQAPAQQQQAQDGTTQDPNKPLQQIPEVAELPPEVATKIAPFTEEFNRTGSLTPESRKAAAAAFGVPEALVDVYMDGMKARQGSQSKPFYDALGGEQNFAVFKTWAETSLSDAEKTAFNSALEKAPNVALYMLEQFKGRFQAQGNGNGPRDITARAGAASQNAGDTYGSQAQVVADMQDQRYRTDEAYRRAVIAKLSRSNFK